MNKALRMLASALARVFRSLLQRQSPSKHMAHKYDVFHLHGDNIVECERTLALIQAALKAELRDVKGPLGSPACPEYELRLTRDPSSVRLVCFPGFGRWNHDIIGHIRDRGGNLREAADVIITGVAEDGEHPVLAIEYCGALPAGNQAWQRSGRAYSFALAGVPFLYVAEIGGYELGPARERKAPRMPNPAVPFSYLCHSADMPAPVLPVFTASPGIDAGSRSAYQAVIADVELAQVVRASILGEDYGRCVRTLSEKVLNFVRLRALSSRGNCTLTPDQWSEAYAAIQAGHNLPYYLLRHARLGWSKTAYIEGLTTTAKKLMELASRYAIGLTSTDLPMCLIPEDRRAAFAQQVSALYPNLPTPFADWLASTRPLAMCWVMGFKPRGDDARPDRGLPPLTRMLVGTKSDLLTVVYGPAPASTWPLLQCDPVTLMEKNGLWEAAMVPSDALLVDSSTDRVTGHGFLKAHWAAIAARRRPTPIHVIPRPDRFGEQDVDTCLHLLLCRLGQRWTFEGMCNPPGGDWSGISLLTADRKVELRWLSLPRVGGTHSKRPDHVFQIFGVTQKPLVLVVESKERAAGVEPQIGPRLIAYLTDLMQCLASIERGNRTGTDWSHTDRSIAPADVTLCSGVAFLLSNGNDIADVRAKANADIVFGFSFKQDSSSCVVEVHPTTATGRLVAAYIKSIPAAEAGIHVEVV